MIKPGNLLKIPPYKCIPVESFPLPDSGFGGFDPTFSYIEPFCHTRDVAFESDERTNRLAKLKRDVPIVGNLAASAELLGLLDCNMDEFNTIPRGARKYETSLGIQGLPRYTIWESQRYFGKANTLFKVPRVVLIVGDPDLVSYQAGTSIDPLKLADYLDMEYDYFDKKRLTVILDNSVNRYYNMYAYGTPCATYNKPFPTPLWEHFEASELLIIRLFPFDNELNILLGGIDHENDGTTDTGVVGYNGMLSSYYRQQAWNSVDGGTPFDPTGFSDYNEFALPGDDAVTFLSAESKYARRKVVVHFQKFAQSPIQFINVIDTTTGVGDRLFRFGVTGRELGHGFGDGKGYFIGTAPANIEIGRDYVTGNGTPYNVSTLAPATYITPQDAAAAVIEDIKSFFGPV